MNDIGTFASLGACCLELACSNSARKLLADSFLSPGLVARFTCMEGHLADIIMCAKFRGDIFRGYNFTGGGRISHFPIDCCMALQQQRYCTAYN